MTPLTIVPLSLVKSLLHTMVMMKSFRFAAVIIALLSSFASAFHPSTSSIHSADAASQSLSRARQGALQASRRSFVEKATLSSIAIAGASLASAKTASASGGATAGGVYLLSAKQRYNARVTAGVKGFLAVGGALESGSIDVVRTFFTSEDDGSWKDFSAAGYLLANAFRRNSSAAPDTLPSVKKWKAFAAQTEAITKALKKKDSAGAMKAYQDAIIALDEYLGLVELPSAKEITSS